MKYRLKKGKRRGEEYIHSAGWKEYAFKILEVYIGNNWIGKNNGPGEWCVVYFWVSRDHNYDKVSKIIIVSYGFM